MKILFINPPYVGWLNDIKVEPLGLLYIAAALRRDGHEVALYDAYIGDPESKYLDLLENWRPDVVACAVYTISEAFCFEAAKICKKVLPGAVFVAGGPHATYMGKSMLERCQEIDLITLKESEETMSELVTLLGNKTDYRQVPGTLCRGSSGEIKDTPERKALKDLDLLPFPARDLLSDEYYRKYNATGVVTSRGCFYKCDFCVSPSFFPGVRLRRIERVAEEIRKMREARGINRVRFYDDVFASSLERMKKVRDLIGVQKVAWDCYIRIDCTTPEMLEVMKEGGCTHVRFGVESGSDSMRRRVKGENSVSFEKHLEVVKKCRELGIKTTASYIFGFPDETPEEMRETIDFADRLGTDLVGFYKLTPYPGTRYWSMLVPEDVDFSNYCKNTNKVSLNKHLDSEQLHEMVKLAYVTYYKTHEIPKNDPDATQYLNNGNK